MRALVTGIAGFAGSHLAEHLLGCNMEVAGIVRPGTPPDNIGHLLADLTLIPCDLNDPQTVERAVAMWRPDLIFHLAAQSSVQLSWSSPVETIIGNAAGQIHLLDAVYRHCPYSRVLIAGSSEEYGMLQADAIPVQENHPLQPLSPYAISKVVQDMVGYQYFRTYGLHIVRMRPFHHTGPRRGTGFVTSDFAKQIADIEKGKQPALLRVGNLDAVRDFTDVRDVVRGYVLALEKGAPGEVYNIASGQGCAIRRMLEMLLDMTDIPIQVMQDPSRIRPADIPVVIGDYSKLHRQTGWQPEIPFERTLADLLQEFRSKD